MRIIPKAMEPNRKPEERLYPLGLDFGISGRSEMAHVISLGRRRRFLNSEKKLLSS